MNRGRGAARRLAFGAGLFAVLFQAILFGWHHHELSIAGRLPTPIVENPAASPQVADDEDGCEICQVLHHLTAATVDIVAVVPPPVFDADPLPAVAVFSARAAVLSFRARAPPLA